MPKMLVNLNVKNKNFQVHAGITTRLFTCTCESLKVLSGEFMANSLLQIVYEISSKTFSDFLIEQ